MNKGAIRGVTVRFRAFVVVIAVAGSSTMASAQTLPPPDNAGLLVPPDLRAGAQAAPVKALIPARTSARPGVAPRARRSEAPSTPHRAQPEHPVDVGVVMRGGSATPKLYSPLGSTQAVRESGSAFGAGMRIGF